MNSRAGWKKAEKAAGVLLLIILSTIFGKTFFKLFNSYDYYHAGCGRYLLLFTGEKCKNWEDGDEGARHLQGC